MADATPIYAIPEPVLTDPLTDLLSVAAVSARVEAILAADTRPNGDSSHSLVLDGADISFTANNNKNILSAAVTLDRDQWVTLSAKAGFTTQSGAGGALIGIYVDVDGVVPSNELTSGLFEMGASGGVTERQQLVIPAYSVFLTAGAHTIRLRGDRDATVATINASGSETQNVPHRPCSLTIIV